MAAAADGPAPSIGYATGVALYLGAVLGAGVLVLPGAAASIAGPASLVAWALACALSVPVALTFSRLAARAPDPSGVAGYGARAFGPSAGAVVGWFYFGAIGVGQAVVTLTGAYYVAALAGLGHGGTFAVAGAFLVAAVAANLAGLRFGGGLQLVLAGAVAVLLGIAIAAGLPRVSAGALTPFAPDGVAAIGRATVTLLFAFFGWEAITHLSSDFRDPARDIPRATRTALVVVSVLYVGLALAVVGTGAHEVDEGRTAVSELIGGTATTGPGAAAAVVAAIVTLATVNTFVAAGSRLGYALARDRAFPALLARRDARGTPVPAVLVVGAVTAASLAVGYAARLGAADLVVVPSTLGLATYVVGTAAALRILAPADRAVAAVALVVCLGLAPFAAGSLLAPIAVGGGALLYGRRRRAREAAAAAGA